MTNENECGTADSEKCSLITIEERACNVLCYHGGIPSNSTTKECICESGYGGECCECEIQDCEMTPWSEWSACTRECGPQGTRFRTRNVAKQPACGGAPCSEIVTQEEKCNRVCYNGGNLDDYSDKCTCPGYSGECCECKIQDCVMTSWSDWSACSQKCGWDGTRFRTRDVYIAPTCGGTECYGFVDHQSCNYGVMCSGTSGYKHPLHIPISYLSLCFSYMYIKLQ
ncbi:A disintegrin and metalloproteinase with thrombospondin motifs adt-2-like [Anneissia japonica]|uniref:A disintegrin and metalloproteinase with thrombospondin motifs adt-2-like n=1 Tax=Anneissia japonica TaxID=1529436 RepID=UPI001425BB53|nr:A disintegrin and metalloproteinase with thrombospondin motifs adt-2-like [Anneissia japonica]